MGKKHVTRGAAGVVFRRGARLRQSMAVSLLACFLAVGCEQERPPQPAPPPLAPVNGRILLDGAPLANAEVFFIPLPPLRGVLATAMTDAQGRYRLHTLHRDYGAPAGQYKVSIRKTVQPNGDDFVPDPQVFRLNAPHRELLPERYSKPDKTGLTATVPPEGAEIDFSLSLSDN